jgi:NitT/TauT family transport system ATP-binding protein
VSASICGPKIDEQELMDEGITLPGSEADIAGLSVSLKGVTKTYDSGVAALGPLDLRVRKGEFVALVGPSGCGKSTALRIIAGLSAATSGEVRLAYHGEEGRPGQGIPGQAIQGQAIPGQAIGFVFQEPTLMPWTSVRENVRLPLKLARLPAAQADARVDEALQRVGLLEFAKSYPRELSGGMKMRVSLARALVTDPDILLMDEPFAALDEITRFRLNNDLLALWRNLRKTVIFVTHSVFESVYLSQRVVVMTSRPGCIAAEISVATVEPRGEEFRTSAGYADYCRRVSAALAPSYSGRSAL